MKLDELNRLLTKGTGIYGFTLQEREQLREQLVDEGVDWANMYQELEMSHRYVDTHRDESAAGEFISLHSHSFYELLFCRSNSGVEYLLGPSRYRLQRGDLIFAPPGVSHRPILPKGLAEPYRRDVVWMSPEFIIQMGLNFPFLTSADWGQGFLLRTGGTAWEELGDQIQDGVREARRRAPGWEAYVAGNTTILLTQVARALAERKGVPLAPAEKPELLDLVFSYIESHLSEQITLADTARYFWVSESKISQIFRQKLGVSFYRYVTQRRLIAAKSLIVQGVPLKAINERVGFADYSTFFRAFKREYGVSPSQSRSLQAGR